MRTGDWIVARKEPDLEELRPIFAGHKDSFRLRVIGDAIQDVCPRNTIRRRKQTSQIDPARNPPRMRGEPHDPIGQPDIGPDLPFDILKFIEPLDADKPGAAVPGADEKKSGRKKQP